MPVHSRQSSTASQTADVRSGTAQRSGGQGNAALVEQLKAGGAFAGQASSLRQQFPGFDQVGGDFLGGSALAAFTDIGTHAQSTAQTTAETTSTATGGAQQVDPGHLGSQPGDGVTGPDVATPARTPPKSGTRAATIYAKHDAATTDLAAYLTAAQKSDLKLFKANWTRNSARYKTVSQKTGVPAPLIAALHWRESTGNFKTYLHQGDRLGRPAVHVPKDIPVFHVWEDAAVHALTMSDKARVRDDLGMKSDTTDAASMATYAEFYNGLGYHNRKKPSPYVYSGTDTYDRGKYVADGRYSSTTKDQQLGVMSMVGAIGGMDRKIAATSTAGARAWASLKAGRTIRRGARGPLVRELQDRLAAAGFPCGTDADFGPTVEKAVKDWQRSQGLEDDGIVGKDVAGKLGPVPAADPDTGPQPGGGATAQS
jgi:lysozyme family protein